MRVAGIINANFNGAQALSTNKKISFASGYDIFEKKEGTNDSRTFAKNKAQLVLGFNKLISRCENLQSWDEDFLEPFEKFNKQEQIDFANKLLEHPLLYENRNLPVYLAGAITEKFNLLGEIESKNIVLDKIISFEDLLKYDAFSNICGNALMGATDLKSAKLIVEFLDDISKNKDVISSPKLLCGDLVAFIHDAPSKKFVETIFSIPELTGPAVGRYGFNSFSDFQPYCDLVQKTNFIDLDEISQNITDVLNDEDIDVDRREIIDIINHNIIEEENAVQNLKSLKANICLSKACNSLLAAIDKASVDDFDFGEVLEKYDYFYKLVGYPDFHPAKSVDEAQAKALVIDKVLSKGLYKNADFLLSFFEKYLNDAVTDDDAQKVCAELDLL